MEKLIAELKKKITELRKVSEDKYDLSEDFLENLYSVYPFNKFEYIISHLIGTNLISCDY